MYIGNFLKTTLASDITNIAVSMTVASGDGADFNTELTRLYGSEKFPYYLSLYSKAYGSAVLDTSREIVKVTARSTDTFTIVRGQRGTSNSAHTSGDNVILGIYADDVADYHNIGTTAYLGTDQLNLVDDTWTKVLLDTELFDLGDDFDSTTNRRFVCDTAGYYAVSGLVGFKTATTVVNKEYNGAVRLNGGSFISGTNYTNLTTGLSVALPVKNVHLAVGDYLELWARSRSGGNTVDLYGHQSANYLSVMLIQRT